MAFILLAVTAQALERTTKVDRPPLVPITLYLQWYHQFQFAGYYAALEQGYYRDAGLDVSIVEGGPGVQTFHDVSSTPGRYGTAHGAGVLLQRVKGQPLVALAAIFQHSPNVIIARADSGISTPHHIPGTRTVIWPGGHVELSAMLLNEGVDPKPFLHEARGDNVKDLIDGKADAIDGYVTNEVFSVKRAGVAVNIIRPSSYGVDFYGDTLITSEREVRDHRKRAEAFRQASLRGWKFALDHSTEIVDLIIARYSVRKTREHLLYEAAETRKLIMPDLVEIGHMNPGRWAAMADILLKQGMIDAAFSLKGFIYDPGIPKNLLVFLGNKGFAPYEFYDNGKPIGANIDLLNALGEILGRPVETRLYQWAESQARLQRGEGHALTLAGINAKRKTLYDFTQATFTFEFALFARSERLKEFENLDLSNKRIAVKQGGFPQSIIENSYPEAKLVLIENIAEGFRLILKGDVDAVVEEKLVGHHSLRENNIHGIEAIEKPLAIRSAHIPVAKGNAALLEELNRAISKLKSTGTIKAISRRWLGGPVFFLTSGERDAALVGGAGTLAVVAVLACLLFLNIGKRNRERTVSEGRLKASLVEKEVLLKEIHHRVKNNLQVISSMLWLQTRAEGNPHTQDVLRDSHRRVMLMAQIHENLHGQDDLNVISASDFLNTLVSDTKASGGIVSEHISFHLDVDDIPLDVDHANVYGQIVSELISNSQKHAFVNGQPGNVEISLHQRDGGVTELIVADDGKGLPEDFDLEQAGTLGLHLVRSLAAKMGGDINIQGSGGTRVQINFKEQPT